MIWWHCWERAKAGKSESVDSDFLSRLSVGVSRLKLTQIWWARSLTKLDGWGMGFATETEYRTLPCSLGIPNLDFQPILSTSKFYSIATWIPWHCSTKIWMSTELAENQDLWPLGYPHHRGVLGFWRIFYTNLKIAQGLREESWTNKRVEPLTMK